MFQTKLGFSQDILEWYRKNKRSLPWRETNDPYKIWVSEVILQQTRVEQGLAYYHRFIEKFPDVGSLARADEDAVMKSWQGLGYYSRARHLHQAAKTIVEEHRGVFPGNFRAIRELRGVGDYTAGAVASIAFGEPQPVIDGNVMRVMSRFLGLEMPVNSARGKRLVQQSLQELMDRDQPGDFNQAVMELGALVCKPRQPDCSACPLNRGCFALGNGKTDELPVISKNVKVSPRYIHYLVIIVDKGPGACTFIRKRNTGDIWGNLYEFPFIETGKDAGIPDLQSTAEWNGLFEGVEIIDVADAWRKRHLLSHRELFLHFLVIRCLNFSSRNLIEVPIYEIDKYPVPKPVEIFLKKVDF